MKKEIGAFIIIASLVLFVIRLNLMNNAVTRNDMHMGQEKRSAKKYYPKKYSEEEIQATAKKEHDEMIAIYNRIDFLENISKEIQSKLVKELSGYEYKIVVGGEGISMQCHFEKGDISGVFNKRLGSFFLEEDGSYYMHPAKWEKRKRKPRNTFIDMPYRNDKMEILRGDLNLYLNPATDGKESYYSFSVR